MEDIRHFFNENNNEFTIYVVEQKFAVGKGLEYFSSFKGKANYIDTDELAQERVSKIHSWIEKKIPPIAELIKICFEEGESVSLIDIIVALNKLFGSQKHQAAGPEVMNPIIIQEGKVIKKYINELINLHKDSFLAPTIIILLKDNNFERAKEMLSECPNGINIKFIYNSGKSEIFKVVNTGAEDINGFINSFAQQCFSTCSKTPHDVLLNKEWADNSLVKLYAPRLLRYRSNLLCDEKNEIKDYLDNCIVQLENHVCTTHSDTILIKNFLCIAKLYRVFCKDFGGTDIWTAHELAKELNNELLLAYVYKYAYFFNNKTIYEQNQMLNEAYKTFVKSNMADNAIYCKNNILVRQFDSDIIRARDFANMVGEAVSDVPGLVGMPHIYNNAGLAYMMTANPDRALELFDQGLEYSKSSERQVQNFAILCNKLITQSYYGERVDYLTLNRVMLQIFDGMVYNNQLPFISARYAMNIFVIALRESKAWAKELLANYDIITLLNQGLSNNAIGSGQLLQQINYVEQKLPEINLKEQCLAPAHIIQQTGRRKKFIENSGLNPFYFFTWI